MKFGTFAAGLALTITLLTSGFGFAALMVTKEEFAIHEDNQRRKDLYQDIKQIENYIKTHSLKLVLIGRIGKYIKLSHGKTNDKD